MLDSLPNPNIVQHLVNKCCLVLHITGSAHCLEAQVQDLLQRTDQIESYEFGLAAINARVWEANLEHVSNYANLLVDSMTDEQPSTPTPK